MHWYLEVLRKYAQFSGRARRKEYWYFALFNLIFSIVLSVIDSLTGTLDSELGLGLLSGIYALAVLIPSIANSFRRMHDTGRSAWWFLIGFIPFIGVIVVLVFMVQDSQEGDNQYGPSPKLVA